MSLNEQPQDHHTTRMPSDSFGRLPRISNLEKGITKPTIDTLKKIADAFSLRLRIQFTGREEE
jgi:hypothetical protein